MLPDIVPYHADPFLADLDKALHGQAPWRYVTAWLPPQLTPVLEGLYFGVFGALVAGSMLAVLVVPRLRRLRTQYVWTFLLSWVLLGNVIAAAFMSAGPNYYDEITGTMRFIALERYLHSHTFADEWVKMYLWHSYVTGEAGAGTGISAFPSMHLAMATMLVLLADGVGPRLKWAASAFCLVILFGSVYLGWHYAVDGYFAIAGTVLIWKIMGIVLNRKEEHAATPEPAAASALVTRAAALRRRTDDNQEKRSLYRRPLPPPGQGRD
jgi:hypothetical protein